MFRSMEYLSLLRHKKLWIVSMVFIIIKSEFRCLISLKRLRLQGTQKIGCSAKIIIKKYALYPEYELKEDLVLQEKLSNEGRIS